MFEVELSGIYFSFVREKKDKTKKISDATP